MTGFDFEPGTCPGVQLLVPMIYDQRVVPTMWCISIMTSQVGHDRFIVPVLSTMQADDISL